MPMPRRPKKRCARRGQYASTDPMVNPGDTAHCEPHGPASDPGNSNHRLVNLEKNPSSYGKARTYAAKNATVMLGTRKIRMPLALASGARARIKGLAIPTRSPKGGGRLVGFLHVIGREPPCGASVRFRVRMRARWVEVREPLAAARSSTRPPPCGWGGQRIGRPLAATVLRWCKHSAFPASAYGGRSRALPAAAEGARPQGPCARRGGQRRKR